VQVKVTPHPVFKREGLNIFSDLYLSIGQACLGSEVTIETLNGPVKMRVPAGVQHGDKQKITGYGIANLPPKQNEKGNHIVTLKVVIPKSLSDIQRDKLLLFQKVEQKISSETGY
jgi:molecular chaperone DnaJ